MLLLVSGKDALSGNPKKKKNVCVGAAIGNIETSTYYLDTLLPNTGQERIFQRNCMFLLSWVPLLAGSRPAVFGTLGHPPAVPPKPDRYRPRSS